MKNLKIIIFILLIILPFQSLPAMSILSLGYVGWVIE